MTLAGAITCCDKCLKLVQWCTCHWHMTEHELRMKNLISGSLQEKLTGQEPLGSVKEETKGEHRVDVGLYCFLSNG